MIDKISSQTVLRFHLSDKFLQLEHVILCRIDFQKKKKNRFFFEIFHENAERSVAISEFILIYFEI
jgi:hypothetical protein